MSCLVARLLSRPGDMDAGCARKLEQCLKHLSANTVKGRQKALADLRSELGRDDVVRALNECTEVEDELDTAARVTWPDIVQGTLGCIAKEAERASKSSSRAGDGLSALQFFIAAADKTAPMLTNVLVRTKENRTGL